ncbi:hypothetical protein PCPL58_p4082 (plasmid) [Pseudomonas cerasi]|nr:hypothetical protein PCPL58_p4009 [Pseudomonas cerasi]CZT26343.1 hypothetical protein PCPL58_p4082 [Pseudomonas cerasi]
MVNSIEPFHQAKKCSIYPQSNTSWRRQSMIMPADFHRQKVAIASYFRAAMTI